MRNKFFVSIVILLSLSSCTRVLMLAMGMQQPEYKTDEEVKEYAQKVFDYEGDILRMKSFSRDGEVKSVSKSLPALMYSDNGKLHRFTTSCLRNYAAIIQEVKLDEYHSRIDTSYLIDDLIEKLYHVEGDEFSIADETFVVFYSRFIGNLNKNTVIPWMEEIEDEMRVPIVFVNCDYSEE